MTSSAFSNALLVPTSVSDAGFLKLRCCPVLECRSGMGPASHIWPLLCDAAVLTLLFSISITRKPFIQHAEASLSLHLVGAFVYVLNQPLFSSVNPAKVRRLLEV